jgi:hypothetical protein
MLTGRNRQADKYRDDNAGEPARERTNCSSALQVPPPRKHQVEEDKAEASESEPF